MNAAVFWEQIVQNPLSTVRRVDISCLDEMQRYNNDAPAVPKEILPGAIYLTEEAAALCRVQPCTIRRAIRRGQIRGRGRPFRILGSELFKLVGGLAP